MIVRKHLLVSTLFAALFMFSNHAWAEMPMWYVEKIENNQSVLEPGTTTYCSKDFHVENLGKESAEVQVIMGNGANYSSDQLEPNGKKSYSLNADLGFTGGWDTSQTSHTADARIVNTTSGTAKIKVHC